MAMKLLVLFVAFLNPVVVFGDSKPTKRIRQSEQAYYICYYFHNGEYPQPSRYNNTVLIAHRYLARCNSEIEYVCRERFNMVLAEGKPAYRPISRPESSDCVTPESVAWNLKHTMLKGLDQGMNATTAAAITTTAKPTTAKPVELKKSTNSTKATSTTTSVNKISTTEDNLKYRTTASGITGVDGRQQPSSPAAANHHRPKTHNKDASGGGGAISLATDQQQHASDDNLALITLHSDRLDDPHQMIETRWGKGFIGLIG